MENNTATSVKEIKTYLFDHYAIDPSSDKLEDILSLCTGLTDVECAEVVKVLELFKNDHGMNKTALERSIKAKRSLGAGDYFEGKTLKGIRVVSALQEQTNYLTTTEDDALRVYSGGVFREDRTRQTQRAIHGLLGDNVSSTHVTNVVSLLKDATTAETPRHRDWVNLANGRLCLSSWELLEHSPAYPSVVQLPVKYLPEAVCPTFDNWLANVLPASDDQFLLLQLLGYSMLQDVRFGKIAVLYGPTHTGKSTCLEVVKAFLGVENVSALTLHALDNEERRFTRAGLVGKLANVSADLSSRYLSGDSQIKQIAAGDAMQVEYKGVQSFSYTPFATLWASSNELPVSHDRSDAWYERLVILPFLKQHTGTAADRTLVSQLTHPSELSGILNRVLDALQVLLVDNIFKETDATREMLQVYKEKNDHVARYLSEQYELAEGNYMLEDDLYDGYKDWCLEGEGIKPLAKTKFREGVQAWGAVRKRKRTSGTDTRYFVFDGMRSL